LPLNMVYTIFSKPSLLTYHWVIVLDCLTHRQVAVLCCDQSWLLSVISEIPFRCNGHVSCGTGWSNTAWRPRLFKRVNMSSRWDLNRIPNVARSCPSIVILYMYHHFLNIWEQAPFNVLLFVSFASYQ
jgi:hypothetical protein